MNIYPRLSQFRQVVGNRVEAVSGSGDESRWLDILEQVSREFDRESRNPMYARVATIYPNILTGAAGLWLPPFISITSVAIDDDQDDTFGLALALNTDYRYWPDHGEQHQPYHRLDRNPNSTAFYGWPYLARRVRVTGVFGYSYETSATGQVVASGGITSSATSLTVVAGHGIDIGETLVIDSEQVYVSGKPNALTLTVTRGVNGTTAAAHSALAVVYRREYPADVVNGILERARYLWHNEFRGGQEPDSLGFATSSWPRWRSLVRAYEVPVAP